MDVRGPEGVGRTPHIDRIKHAEKTYKASEAGASRSADAVELSEKARMLSKLSQMPDVRWEKVLDIKKQIDAGTYETPEKLESALEKMLAEMYGPADL